MSSERYLKAAEIALFQAYEQNLRGEAQEAPAVGLMDGILCLPEDVFELRYLEATEAKKQSESALPEAEG